MSYRIGFVGLPNVGKSSFFKFLTNRDVLIANYHFATLDPNIGSFDIKDPCLEKLADHFSSEKIFFNKLELVDIAGLIRGASEGAGLGNKFLSHVREVDIVCHVLRSFHDSEIIHSEETVNPIRDFETICLELILSDLQQIEKRERKIKGKENENERRLFTRLKNALNEEKFINALEFSEEELFIVNSYNFLTKKNFFLLVNSSNNSEEEKFIRDYASDKKINFFIFPLKIVEEFSKVELEEARQNLKYSIFKLVKENLSLKNFYTAGPKEVRGWLTTKKSNAKECASLIHSDIAKNFIKLEVFNFHELESLKSKKNIIRKEGKDYIVAEGDVCNFIFGKNKS